MVTSAQWSKGVPVLLKPIEISFGLEPELGGMIQLRNVTMHIIH